MKETITIWTCDLCGEEAKTQKSLCPDEWKELTVALPGTSPQTKDSELICPDCMESFDLWTDVRSGRVERGTRSELHRDTGDLQIHFRHIFSKHQIENPKMAIRYLSDPVVTKFAKELIEAIERERKKRSELPDPFLFEKDPVDFTNPLLIDPGPSMEWMARLNQKYPARLINGETPASVPTVMVLSHYLSGPTSNPTDPMRWFLTEDVVDLLDKAKVSLSADQIALAKPLGFHQSREVAKHCELVVQGDAVVPTMTKPKD